MKECLWFMLSIVLFAVIGLSSGWFNFPGGIVQASSDSPAQVSEKPGSQPQPGGENQKAGPLPAAKIETVKIEIVKTQPFTRTTALTGAVTPTRTARLASPGEGPVESCEVNACLVREGDRVQKGQILLQISRNKAAQAQLTAARQTLKEQETELQRITQLVQGGAVPGAQLDSAQSKYENAKAQLAKAVESNEDYLIAAPWSGIVSKVFVTEGDYVAPRAPLIEIFDPASLVVQFAVPEAESTQVHKNMPVQVQLDAHPGKNLQGTVSRVYPQLDDRTRTRNVEAALSDPVALLPGMFARVRMVLFSIPDAVTVPAYSLVPNPNGSPSAFVAEDGKAVRRDLTLGEEIDGRVHILSGLKPGDQLIVAGQEKLKDGAMVKVMASAAESIDGEAKGGERS
jgi:membrane fusion protein (multidrug efflux system)